METLEVSIYPSQDQINRTVHKFGEQSVYQLPDSSGDGRYYAYLMPDAAYDVLEEDGFSPSEPSFRERLQLLSQVAATRIENYKGAESGHFALMDELNLKQVA